MLPRSPRQLFAGLVMIGRTTDKARMYVAGRLGDYTFGAECPMDSLVWEFLDLDPHVLVEKIRPTGSDDELEIWIAQEYVSKKTSEEITRWNDFVLTYPQAGSPAYAWMPKIREQYYSKRPDLVTFVDMLDADEGRHVPVGGTPTAPVRVAPVLKNRQG